MPPFLSVKESLNRLLSVPAPYAQETQDAEGKGWFMHLDQPNTNSRYRAYPGVYSTSFAVQLLSFKRAIASKHSELIVQGLNYLVGQFKDSEALEGTPLLASECKQSHKKNDVGHHDFALTFKLCAVLQAANSIATVVDCDVRFSQALARHSDALDRMATRLKSFAVTEREGSRIFRAWPWHTIGKGDRPEIDPVPTAEALLTLTHPSLRSSTRWLSENEEVTAYLIEVASADDTTLLHRCVAASALFRLGKETHQDYLSDAVKTELIQKLQRVLRDSWNVPWQEVMHYPVPSGKQTISHYKPWIWLFPRIHYVECLCFLDQSSAVAPASKAIAEILANIQANNGRVVFVQAEPPALLATLRCAQLIDLVDSTVMGTVKGRLTLNFEQLTNASRRIQRWFTGFLLFLLLFLQLRAATASIETADVTIRSLQMLRTAGSKLLSVWPIWIVAFVMLFLVEDGDIRKRLKSVLVTLLIVVVLGIVVNILAGIK